jgi:DeoR/GlpR family transcriptional regulator of sugar metabolism
MLARERYDKIINILELDGSVKTSKLSKVLNVSLETIRRDLDVLHKEGKLRKVHGGAVLEKEKINVLPYTLREDSMKEEKVEISKITFEMIDTGDVIGLNGSTTNIQLAKMLKNSNKEITVVTNSYLISQELIENPKIQLITVGGRYDREEFAFFGDNSVKFLEQFSVNKAFLSVGGVTLKRGITDFSEKEVQISKKFVEIADEIIVVADSSKIGNNSLIKICDLEEVNVIVTDSKIDKRIKTEYSKNGIEVKSI